MRKISNGRVKTKNIGENTTASRTRRTNYLNGRVDGLRNVAQRGGMALKRRRIEEAGFGRIDCEVVRTDGVDEEVLDEEEMYTILFKTADQHHRQRRRRSVINTDTMVFRTRCARRRAKFPSRRQNTKKRRRRGRMGTLTNAFTKKNEQKKKDEATWGTQDGRRFKDGKNGCKRRRVVTRTCVCSLKYE